MTHTFTHDRGVAADLQTSMSRIGVAADLAGRRAFVRCSTDAATGAPVVRPVLLHSGASSASLCLVPEGALLLAGDSIRLEVDVGPGCAVEIREPAGSVAYDMRGASARWDVHLRIGAGASLVWHGEPFVVAQGARVLRTLTGSLGSGARLMLRETLVLGRTGETAGGVQTHTHLADGTRPVLVEHLTLGSGGQFPAALGSHRVLDSVISLRPRPVAIESAAPRYNLESGGSLWRVLAGDTHRTGLDAVWADL